MKLYSLDNTLRYRCGCWLKHLCRLARCVNWRRHGTEQSSGALPGGGGGPIGLLATRRLARLYAPIGRHLWPRASPMSAPEQAVSIAVPPHRDATADRRRPRSSRRRPVAMFSLDRWRCFPSHRSANGVIRSGRRANFELACPVASRPSAAEEGVVCPGSDRVGSSAAGRRAPRCRRPIRAERVIRRAMKRGVYVVITAVW